MPAGTEDDEEAEGRPAGAGTAKGRASAEKAGENEEEACL